jgi:3-oxoacyl-[acyl-carrier-protein] synthase II
MTTVIEDALLQRVYTLACEALGKSRQELTLDTPLSELGLDSLDTAELVLEVESVFEVRISDGVAARLRTLRDVATVVAHGGSADGLAPQDTQAPAGSRPEPVTVVPMRHERVVLPTGDDARVVITGMGVVSPVGSDVATMFAALLEGRSGVGPYDSEYAEVSRVRIAAQAQGFDESHVLRGASAKRHGRFALMALSAARQAVAASGVLQAGYAPERVGVILGVGVGGLEVMDRSSALLHQKGPRHVPANAVIGFVPNMAAGLVSQELGARGPSYVVASACASGAHALGQALLALRSGVVDVVVAGGTEGSLTPLALAGFAQIGALSRRNDEPTRASRPFDRDRDGFVIGEGAGVLVLERLGPARKRGAHVHAELAGSGASSDAYHPVEPDPQGRGATLAMLAALNDAQLAPDAIGYVNAHGTSTPHNDRVETLALKQAFGAHVSSLWVSSTKSMMGHLLGAAGAVEAIVTALVVEQGRVPPTINLDAPDPACDLDYVPHVARERRIEAALSNSFAFGGQNAALLLRRVS